MTIRIRPNGYYWVRFEGTWIPGYYDIDISDPTSMPWMVVGSDEIFREEELVVGPKIEPPE